MDNGRSQQFRKKIWHIWVKLNISIDIQFMLFKFNLTVRKEQSERVFVSNLFQPIYAWPPGCVRWTNSVDPDEMTLNVPSHKALHCL